MINIAFDDRSVFTYSANDLSIQAWDHEKRWLNGRIIGMVGEIKFANFEQLEMFHEMLDLLIESVYKKKNANISPIS